MRDSLRALCLLSLLTLASAPVFAIERLFVFHSGTTVHIYDAETFDLLGSPEVGTGAVQAIGVPDPDNPSQFLKYFVITAGRAVVLEPDPPFAVRRRLALTGGVNLGEESAILAPNGRHILVASGTFLFIFDPLDPSDPAPFLIRLTAAATSITVTADSTQAHVTVEGRTTTFVIRLDGDMPRRFTGPVEFDSIPTKAIAAPNDAGLFISEFDKVTAINPYSNEVVGTPGHGGGLTRQMGFYGEAPVNEMFIVNGTNVSTINLNTRTFDFVVNPPSAVDKAVSTETNLLFMLSKVGGRIFRTNRDGSQFRTMENPATGAPFTLPPIDIEKDRFNRNLFIALGGTGSVMRLSRDGTEIQREITPPDPPDTIEVLSTPGSATTRLQVYGGLGQAGPANTPLPIRFAVRALDIQGRGVFGQTLTLNGFAPGVIFNPDLLVTNAYGVASFEVVPPVDTPFEVEARAPNGLTARFPVNDAQAGAAGLSVLSGDHEIAIAGDDFPRMTTIRAITNGVLADNIRLTITRPDDTVMCPATVFTTNGEASFQCSAGNLPNPFPRVVRVQVRDETGRRLARDLTFTVVPAFADLPREPQRITRGVVEGMAGTTINRALEMRLRRNDGFGVVPNVGAEFAADRDRVTFDPLIVPSGADGTIAADMTFGCRLGEGEVVASVNTPGLPETTFRFRNLPGEPALIRRIQGNGTQGDANERLDGPAQALIGRLIDSCSNGIPSVDVTYLVTPPGAATLENAFRRTNVTGEISTLVRLGDQAGPVAITMQAGGMEATFNLVVNVTPTTFRKTQGDTQDVPAGEVGSQLLTVQLLNDNGAPAPGRDVTFSVVEGVGFFESMQSGAILQGTPTATVRTDDAGQASVAVRAGAMLGTLRVEARSGDIVTVFDLQVVGRTPQVSAVGFVNGASFIVGWVPGSLGTIFGTGLTEGIDGAVVASGPPFPTDLRGVRVVVNGVPAPIIALSNINGAEQVSVQVPFFTQAPSNAVNVELFNNGVSAVFPNVRTLIAQPGVFEVTLPSGRFVAALHADGSLIEPLNPARPGEVISIFWTGGGPVAPAVATNTAGPVQPLSHTVNQPLITLDDRPLQVQVSVLAPFLLTVYQSNVTVHPDSPDGFLPFSISMIGVRSLETHLPVQR